jgi:hypothetical protein
MPVNAQRAGRSFERVLALARLEPAMGLVDDVQASLAAHEAIVAMARAKRFQRVSNFHVSHQLMAGRADGGH